MITSRVVKAALFLLVMPLLISCGGGGGSDPNNNNDSGGTDGGTTGGTVTVGTSSNPAQLKVGASQQSTVAATGAYYYVFTAGTSSGSHAISLTNTQSDLSWDLYSDANYSSLFVYNCDKNWGTQDEVCTVLLTANAKYYLRVNNWDNVTSTYTVAVNFLDPAAGCGSGTCLNFETGSVPTAISMSGNLPWTVDNATSATGAYSIRSGAITHNQSSCFEYTPASSTSIVTFSLKTDSEEYVDKLKFYIDGSLQSATWSGATPWIKVMFNAAAGSHTYKWCYTKDSSMSNGADAVWVDDIEFK